MNREDRKVTEAYIQAVLSEREQCLYQNALNKVRVITRSMKPAEKEEYLQSDAFRNTLRQLQRRDRIYQGLLHHELVQPGAQSERDRLSRLIAGELQAGRKVNLSFLRTVEKCHVPLEKAYRAIQVIREATLRHWMDDHIGSLTVRAENKIVLWMRTGDAASCLRGEDTETSVVRRVMQKSFPGGLTDQLCCPLPEEIRDNLSHIFFSGSSSLPLHGFILHPIGERPLTGKQLLTLQVAVHHQDCRRVVVHFPDDHRHGLFPGKLGSMMPPVAGDHFIAAIRRRPRNSGNHDTVPTNAFHGPFHGFVIQHLERVIFERMQLGKRYFLHLLRRLVSTALLG